jgi:cytochrome P450
MANRPTRPPWRDFLSIHRALAAGLLPGLEHIHRRYGRFVQTRLPLELYFVSEPACIEEILVKKADSFIKDRTNRLLKRVVGNGLLVNEGESWLRQRRLVQPAFHQRQLQGYATVMTTAIARAAEGWKAGETRDVHEDMMAVTMSIVAETLFGADVSTDTADVGRVIAQLMDEFSRILGIAARFQPPEWVPTPANRRLRASSRKLDALVLRMIAARRARPDGASGDDLLSLLLRARDEDGTTMTDAQVRDEAVMLFLAGHETTALVLTYALHLLALHPEEQARLGAEIDRVSQGRAPALGDLDALTFTDAVVQESMRLYPPAWGIAREAIRDVEIGGFAFRKGAEFVMSPFIVHRDPAIFPEPEAFRPARWENDLLRRLPRFAYFPFGGGPRVCIGNRFAMMEAKLVLATIVQRFRFEATSDAPLKLLTSVTLRPEGAVRLRLRAA